ncbi:MAG: hypothetical protein JST00_35010 [Deltaproteobacteria bacterium]|nr:hypothetical protein [Deltaproteobacteria bacterium]
MHSTANATPTRPCPTCSGTSFLRMHQGFIELSAASRIDTQLLPRCTLVVCEACGRMDWYTDPRALATYWQSMGARIERIDVPGAAPYRG